MDRFKSGHARNWYEQQLERMSKGKRPSRLSCLVIIIEVFYGRGTRTIAFSTNQVTHAEDVCPYRRVCM